MPTTTHEHNVGDIVWRTGQLPECVTIDAVIITKNGVFYSIHGLGKSVEDECFKADEFVGREEAEKRFDLEHESRRAEIFGGANSDGTPTLQFKILTGYKVIPKDDGSLAANPFFNASIDFVKASIEEATSIYSGLFPFFIEMLTSRRNAPSLSIDESLREFAL